MEHHDNMARSTWVHLLILLNEMLSTCQQTLLRKLEIWGKFYAMWQVVVVFISLLMMVVIPLWNWFPLILLRSSGFCLDHLRSKQLFNAWKNTNLGLSTIMTANDYHTRRYVQYKLPIYHSIGPVSSFAQESACKVCIESLQQSVGHATLIG